MTNTELHAFLRLELPCRESEIVSRLALLKRALPATYASWPGDKAGVAAAMQGLQAEGLCELRGKEWWWLGRVVKAEKATPQMELFA